MKLNKLIVALVLCLPIAGVTGCKLITATSTPGVTQFYSQAALVLNDFSGVLGQAQQLFTTAHTLALVSDLDYRNGQQAFLSIASNGDAIQTLLKSGADQATVTAQLNALIAQVGAMPALFHIKNPATQAEFTALVTSMQNILNASLTLVK
jgi:hypothetical protein